MKRRRILTVVIIALCLLAGWRMVVGLGWSHALTMFAVLFLITVATGPGRRGPKGDTGAMGPAGRDGLDYGERK